MKKIGLTTFFTICIILSALAQSNFKDGYIITNTNDTLMGFIDFRTDYTNSQQCKFKFAENIPEKIYLPGEIAGFRFVNEGKYYVSKNVEVDSLKRTVFLEFLVQGLLNLYYLPQGNGYYFFENKDGKIISTTKEADKIVEIDDLKQMKVDNRFKGVLSYVLKEDLSLATKTSDAIFSRTSMIEYTKKYHEHVCESGEKCIIFENDYKKRFTKFDFTAFSGFELNEMVLNYDDFSKMQSFSPILGVGINISSPRLMKSLNLIFDFTVSEIAGGCDYFINNNTYYQFKFSALKTNFCTGLEYIYEKGKIRPAINFGFSWINYINVNATLKSHSVSRSFSFIDNQPLSGFKTGIGFDYQIKNNQFIVLRLLYSKNTNIYDYNNNFYQLKIGYKF